MHKTKTLVVKLTGCFFFIQTICVVWMKGWKHSQSDENNDRIIEGEWRVCETEGQLSLLFLDCDSIQ